MSNKKYPEGFEPYEYKFEERAVIDHLPTYAVYYYNTYRNAWERFDYAHTRWGARRKCRRHAYQRLYEHILRENRYTENLGKLP